MDTSTKRTIHAWLVLAILICIGILAHIDRAVISLLIDPIRESFGITDMQLSLVMGLAFGFTYSLASVPMGYFIDKFSRRVVLSSAVAVWTSASIASGFSSSYAQLFLARIGIGAGESALQPGAFSIISDLFPLKRLALATSIFSAVGILGGAAALALGGFVYDWLASLDAAEIPTALRRFEPWQGTLILIAMPGFLLALLLLLVKEPVRRSLFQQQDTASPEEFISFLKRRAAYFIPHMVGFGMLAVMAYGFASWGPAHLMRDYGLTASQAGMRFAITSGPAGLAGFLFSGWYVDRRFAAGVLDVHLRYFIVTTAALFVFSIVFLILIESLFATTLAIILVFFLIAFSGVAAASLQIVTPSQFRGRVSAIYVMVYNLMGMIMGPAAVTLVAKLPILAEQGLGKAIGFVFVGGAPLAIICFYFALRPARNSVRELIPSG